MVSEPAHPVVAELCGRLLPEAAELGRDMAAMIKAEIPLYRDGQVVPDDELDAACTDNVRYILGNLAGQVGVSDDAPRRTGAARAEKNVSYAAVLQAFRLGSRFLWETLVERSRPEERGVLVRAAAEIWAVSDDLAAQVTDGYRATLAERARRDAQLRVALLDALFDPDAIADEWWESARLIDQPRRGEFVVVVGECPTPGQEAIPGVETLLGKRGLLSLWRQDHEYQEGLVALRVGYRIDQLAADLTAIAAGRLGLAAVFTNIEEAPAARREAKLACAAATPRSCEMVRYDGNPLPVLLASTAETARWYAARVLGDALDETPEHELLRKTARVWIDAGGSSSVAADQLYVHRNTIRYRLRRLEQLTGRDLTNPTDVAEIHVALECARIHALESHADAATPDDRGPSDPRRTSCARGPQTTAG